MPRNFKRDMDNVIFQIRNESKLRSAIKCVSQSDADIAEFLDDLSAYGDISARDRINFITACKDLKKLFSGSDNKDFMRAIRRQLDGYINDDANDNLLPTASEYMIQRLRMGSEVNLSSVDRLCDRLVDISDTVWKVIQLVDDVRMKNTNTELYNKIEYLYGVSLAVYWLAEFTHINLKNI